MKELIRPTGYPTDDELKAKLKENKKEIDKLTTIIAGTEKDTAELKKKRVRNKIKAPILLNIWPISTKPLKRLLLR